MSTSTVTRSRATSSKSETFWAHNETWAHGTNEVWDMNQAGHILDKITSVAPVMDPNGSYHARVLDLWLRMVVIAIEIINLLVVPGRLHSSWISGCA